MVATQVDRFARLTKALDTIEARTIDELSEKADSIAIQHARDCVGLLQMSFTLRGVIRALQKQ